MEYLPFIILSIISSFVLGFYIVVSYMKPNTVPIPINNDLELLTEYTKIMKDYYAMIDDLLDIFESYNIELSIELKNTTVALMIKNEEE